MKKNLIAWFSVLAFSFSFMQAQDLEEILENHFKTIGQKKFLEIQTVVSTGSFVQMGMNSPFRIMQKRPDKYYLEAEFQDVTMQQGFDGVNAWMVAPWTGSMEPTDITGPQLKSMKQQSDFDGLLWNWKEKGHQLELVGTEELEGTEVYNLKLTTADGDVIHYYIDSDNFVVLMQKTKTVMNNAEMEAETYLSNFKPVNDVMVPFNIETRVGGQSMMQIIIDEIKFDEEVPDSLFVKPVTGQ